MVARTVLTKRRSDAVHRIEEQAMAKAYESPEIAEAAERIRSAKGPDEVHTEVFRLEAIADLWELVNEKPASPAPKPQAAKRTTKAKK